MPQDRTPTISSPILALPAQGPDATRLVLQTFFGKAIRRAWLAVRQTVDGPGMHGGRLDRVKRELATPRSACVHYVNTTTIREGATDRNDANFEAAHILMIDDVGEVGVNGALIDKALMDAVAPEATFVVETSEGNFQYQYKLDPPAADARLYLALKTALRQSPVWGQGSTTHGLVQYARLPSGENIKPGKNSFRTRLVEASLKSYTLEALAKGFGVELLFDDEVEDESPSAPPSAPPSAGVHADTGNTGESTGSKKPFEHCSVEAGIFLIKTIKNDARFEARDDWIAVGAALKNACGDTFETFEGWMGFCEQIDQRAGEPERVWDSLHAPFAKNFSDLHGWAFQDAEGDSRGTQALARIVFGHEDAVSTLDMTRADTPQDLLSEAEARAIGNSPDDDEEDDDPQPAPRSFRGLARQALAGLRVVSRAIPDWEAESRGKPREINQVIIPGVERDEITVIGGQSGVMKSIILLHMALAIANERPDMLGVRKIEFAGDVVLYANEDARKVIDKRVDAMELRHRIAPGFKHKLYVRAGQAFVKTHERAEFGWNPKIAAEILDMVQQSAMRGATVGVVALDTLASSALGSDESNREMQTIASLCAQLARTVHCAVIVVHHFRKGAVADDREDAPQPTQEALRGGSTMGASTRNIAFAERPTRADMRDFGLTEDEARSLVRIRPIKRSYGPLGDTQWFKREAVTIRVPFGGGMRDEEHPALVPVAMSSVQHRLDTLRDALAKIEIGLKLHGRVILTSRNGGQAHEAQNVLGKSQGETEQILSDLVRHGVIKIEEIKDSKRRARPNVVLSGIDFPTNPGKHGQALDNEEEYPF